MSSASKTSSQTYHDTMSSCREKTCASFPMVIGKRKHTSCIWILSQLKKIVPICLYIVAKQKLERNKSRESTYCIGIYLKQSNALLLDCALETGVGRRCKPVPECSQPQRDKLAMHDYCQFRFPMGPSYPPIQFEPENVSHTLSRICLSFVTNQRALSLQCRGHNDITFVQIR